MVLVGEIMQASPVCVDADDTVVEVARTLLDAGLDEVPVCRDDDYVSMVGETDIVRDCVALFVTKSTDLSESHPKINE